MVRVLLENYFSICGRRLRNEQRGLHEKNAGVSSDFTLEACQVSLDIPSLKGGRSHHTSQHFLSLDRCFQC